MAQNLNKRPGADIEQAADQVCIAMSALAAALKKEADRAAGAAGVTAGRRPEAAAVPPPQPEFTFRPVKTMREAAAAAEEYCGAWRIDGDTDDTRLGPAELMYACEQQDLQTTLDPQDDSKYYLVKQDGSIGLTLDGCRNIEWIFLPA